MKRELTGKRGHGLSLMKDRKGLSEIVATLIIILLVIIAIGIIWTVVRNVITGGTEQIALSTKCNAVDITAESVVPQGVEGEYNVRLGRGSDSEETVEGVKITFYNNETNSLPVEFGTTLDPLDHKTQVVNATLWPESNWNATKITYTAYFISDSGEVQLCPGWTRTYEWTN
ncbi:MAG: hypothetical protein KKC19_00675 [Nanoarchaeota archaeon]|nr:hypothetical protein [Nanoarchaeota archaeon]